MSPEEKKEYMRKWWAANPEKKAEYAALKPKYVLTPEQLERARQASRKWRAANPETVKASQTRYYAKHKNTRKKKPCPEKARAYRKRNLEKARPLRRLYEAKRRAGMKGHVSAKEWRVIDHLFAGMCAYCIVVKGTTVDHVVPISRGGTHTPDNVVPCCEECNFSKHNKSLPIWLLTRRKAP